MPSITNKFVCVVGASAGGLDAISKLLAQLPKEQQDLAVIVAQHLSPTHKSRLVDLLQKATSWPVEEAKNGVKLSYGKVLITPPDKDISIENEKVILNASSSIIGTKPSVNVLFTSASECCQDRVIGVILSGSGSDGAAGIENIKLNNGITLVQDPSEAAYDGMPNTAIESGMVDKVFQVEEFGQILENIFQHKFNPSSESDGGSLSDFDLVINLLAKRSKVDFADYKEATRFKIGDSIFITPDISNLGFFLLNNKWSSEKEIRFLVPSNSTLLASNDLDPSLKDSIDFLKFNKKTPIGCLKLKQILCESQTAYEQLIEMNVPNELVSLDWLNSY